MSQKGKSARIADDFPSIAARMRALGIQSEQVPASLGCAACNDRGWYWSLATHDWRKCRHCIMSEHRPKPDPRR